MVWSVYCRTRAAMQYVYLSLFRRKDPGSVRYFTVTKASAKPVSDQMITNDCHCLFLDKSYLIQQNKLWKNVGKVHCCNFKVASGVGWAVITGVSEVYAGWKCAFTLPKLSLLYCLKNLKFYVFFSSFLSSALWGRYATFKHYSGKRLLLGNQCRLWKLGRVYLLSQ